MKQNFILWLSSIIIAFLAGYMNNVTGPNYPVSGSIGLDGQPATFKFDRTYRGNDGYFVTVNTDEKDINAFLLYRNVPKLSYSKIIDSGSTNDIGSWQKAEMNYSGKLYSGKLPVGKPGQKIMYRVELNYKGNKYYLPTDKAVTIQLWGKVNPEILRIYYFVLFLGLILAVRTGLEVFKDKPKVGIYTIFTVISFFLYAVCVVPLVKSYELNAINHSVPPVSQLVSVQSVSLMVLWIIGMIVIFNYKGKKFIPITLTALTLIIYIALRA